MGGHSGRRRELGDRLRAQRLPGRVRQGVRPIRLDQGECLQEELRPAGLVSVRQRSRGFCETEASQDDCENDDSWEYIARNGRSKRCRWVGKKSYKRCNKTGVDGVKASKACPEECDSSC